MSREDGGTTLHALYDAWNNRDEEALLSLVNPDSEVFFEATGQTLVGYEGWRQFLQSWATAFPDNRKTVDSLIADVGGAAAEALFHGTHTGPLIMPTGEIPPTGQSVRHPFAVFIHLENGKVSRYHAYFDLLDLLRQLGLAPAPEHAAV